MCLVGHGYLGQHSSGHASRESPSAVQAAHTFSPATWGVQIFPWPGGQPNLFPSCVRSVIFILAATHGVDQNKPLLASPLIVPPPSQDAGAGSQSHAKAIIRTANLAT